MKPEFIYVIRVMTTKRGKLRKEKAYAKLDSRGHWFVVGPSLVWLVVHRLSAIWLCSRYARTSRKEAQNALGCKCKVVKLRITEVT